MSKISFMECGEEVYTLMYELINEYHMDLRNAKIKCLFYDKARKSEGKLVLGTAEVVSPKYNYLTDIDFIISIYGGTWDIMAEQERKALLDHELCHLFITEDRHGEPVYKTIPHDLSEFKAIIERYGVGWQDNIYVDDDNAIEEDGD